MTFNDDKVKYELRIIRMIHSSLGAGLLLFAGIAFVFAERGEIQEKNDLHLILLIIATVLSIAGMLGSRYLFTRMLLSLRAEPFFKKVKAYRNANIVRFSLLESPALFALACYMITGSFAYLLITTILFILFLIARPGEFKMRMDLGQE